MKTILHPAAVNQVMMHAEKRPAVWSQFINWCEGQEKNRFVWLAAAIGGHGCVVTPITLLVIMLAGNSFFLWPVAIMAMAAPLIVNLAALPTKYTVPIFLLSVLVDVLLVVNCVVVAMM